MLVPYIARVTDRTRKRKACEPQMRGRPADIVCGRVQSYTDVYAAPHQPERQVADVAPDAARLTRRQCKGHPQRAAPASVVTFIRDVSRRARAMPRRAGPCDAAMPTSTAMNAATAVYRTV